MHDTRRTRAVLGVLIVAALVLITVSYRSGKASAGGGISRAGAAVIGGAENLVSSAGHLFRGSGSAGQVTALQKQVVQLNAQLARERLSKADYAQLRQLLTLSGQGGYRIVAATVIATAQGYQQRVTLDAGSADGVRPQETVLNGHGLVGQVTAVTAHTATVLLATASTSQVGVELAPSGQLGFVAGPGKTPSGTGRLELQLLDGNVVLRPGEQLVTSASVNNRPFVAGVPVGVIAAVQNRAGALTARALVRPYVNFTALGVVGIVVVPPRHDPRFSVLPPIPRPLPAVTVTVTPRARSGAGPRRTPPAVPGGGG